MTRMTRVNEITDMTGVTRMTKRLDHGFGKISQQNVFDVILESTKHFNTTKNRQLKKLKNQDFSKGVSPWFWSKI